jgi:hypothetical protein
MYPFEGVFEWEHDESESIMSMFLISICRPFQTIMDEVCTGGVQKWHGTSMLP